MALSHSIPHFVQLCFYLQKQTNSEFQVEVERRYLDSAVSGTEGLLVGFEKGGQVREFVLHPSQCGQHSFHQHKILSPQKHLQYQNRQVGYR